MKTRVLTLLAVLFSCLLAALSTGSKIYLLFAILLAAMALLSFASVTLAGRSASVSHTLSSHRAQRGELVTLEVVVKHKSFLPIAPITITLSAAPGEMPITTRLPYAGSKSQRLAYRFPTTHVGVFTPGVQSYLVEDVFGFFARNMRPDTPPLDLMVLPLPFEVDPLQFSPGDTGLESMARAREDPSTPSDVRPYQPGDPLKKVHWKLSMRKRELMVRRFEEPALPDALVLLDCGTPSVPDASQPQTKAFLQDALCETAASVVLQQMRGDHPVRLPLLGKRPIEYDKSMGAPALLEELARLDFSQTERFERVLLLETRRMRRTGATVIITSRLNSTVADMIIRIRRMGPYVRLYLTTFSPEAPAILPLISRLQQNSVEVCYVTPSES